MVNKSKQIGTKGERDVKNHLAANGFPHAERRALAGAEDRGDVLAHLDLVFEVKAGKSAKTAGAVTISHWLGETEDERQNAGASIGLLVVQRINRETPGAGGWDCYMPMWALIRLKAGFWVHRDGSAPYDWRGTFGDEPVRVTFDVAITMLRAAGYGDALAEVA